MGWATPHTPREPNPPRQSVLSKLSAALEPATDAYAAACDATAKAENDYEREYHAAYTRSTGESHAAKDAEASAAAAEQKFAVRLAKAAEKATKAKVSEIERRLNAAQSHTRFVREQT